MTTILSPTTHHSSTHDTGCSDYLHSTSIHSATLPTQLSDLTANTVPLSTSDPILIPTIARSDLSDTYQTSKYPSSVLHSVESNGYGSNGQGQNDIEKTNASFVPTSLDIVYGSSRHPYEFLGHWIGLDPNGTDHDQEATAQKFEIAHYMMTDDPQAFPNPDNLVFVGARGGAWVLCLSEEDKYVPADADNDAYFARSTNAVLRVRDADSKNGYLNSNGWWPRASADLEERIKKINLASETAFSHLNYPRAGVKAAKAFSSATDQRRNAIMTVISIFDRPEEDKQRRILMEAGRVTDTDSD